MNRTAILVDDEALARERLRALVGRIQGVEIVGEAADGATAVRVIDELEPDIVFLDIEIPPPSGLELLDRLRHRPLVIFTTAFSEHAVSAFELAAVDYLVKPFDLDRVRVAVERAVEQLGREDAPSSVERAREALGSPHALDRLFVRHGSAAVPLVVTAVARFEARDDYVEVHAGGQAYRLNMRLSDLARRLDPQRFLRVHRSHIVNLDYVRAFHPYDAHRLLVELRDGMRIVASRSGSQTIRARIP